MMYQLSIETKGRYIMTVRELYLITLDNASIILKDPVDDEIYFKGVFLDVPFRYLNYIVSEIRAIGNTLVVRIYN